MHALSLRCLCLETDETYFYNHVEKDDYTDTVPYSFFEWREPARTKATLGILTFCWLIITLVPLPLLVKITQFIMGVIFFGLFPLATRYPQYRLLASPLKWLLWRIPTDGEDPSTRSCLYSSITKSYHS